MESNVADPSVPDLLPLAGYPVRSMDTAQLCALLQARLQARQQTALVFANTHLVVQCQHLRTWMSSGSVVLVNDGLGMDLAALLRHGRRYSANLNGTDFVPHLLRTLRLPRKLFLYGGKPGVALAAAQLIRRDLHQEVVGVQDGYSRLTAAELRKVINRSGADTVLVALGNPLQETWIHANAPSLDAQLLVGVGALFDFLAGTATRAPRWVQRLRLEWLFRLCREPRRLTHRYTVGTVQFLLLCLRYPRP